MWKCRYDPKYDPQYKAKHTKYIKSIHFSYLTVRHSFLVSQSITLSTDPRRIPTNLPQQEGKRLQNKGERVDN